jgi:signal transduction histidine kinase/ActR/RegA family two-component response regulator
MRKKNTLLQIIFGNPEDNILEDQIPIVLSFATATLSLVAMTLNTILGLSLIMILIPLCASIAMFFVCFKLRYSRNKYLYKVLMAIVAFTYFNFLWFNNYASYGPTLYLFLLFFIFVIMIFDGKSRLLLSLLVFINILVLFLIEYFANGSISRYIDDETRIMDIYFSFYIYLVFTLIMALVIRYYYRLERTKAKKSDQLKSAFLSNMSHEIRTPMNAILGFSKLLEYAKSENERNEYVNIINVNGKMLIDLLDDIMDMSKMDAGQFDISIKTFQLNDVMKELGKVIRLNLDQQGKREILLTLISDAENITVYSDENRIKQVLYNFLTNASKFTLKGEITFGYKVINKNVEFYVTDTGIGIKKEFFKDIFNRFYKVDNAEYKTLPRGSGIGLSICRIIADKLGGSVSVNSDYGKGSTFKFTLPSIVVDANPANEVKAIPKVVFNPAGKVLVTEDDRSNMLLITTILRKTGVPYKTASDGAEALEVFTQNQDIELVLMDINLPLMNGYEALKELKLIKPALPVVALSAHAMQVDMENALAKGFDGYITKPIDQALLLDCLKKHLSWKTIPSS